MTAFVFPDHVLDLNDTRMRAVLLLLEQGQLRFGLGDSLTEILQNLSFCGMDTGKEVELVHQALQTLQHHRRSRST